MQNDKNLPPYDRSCALVTETLRLIEDSGLTDFQLAKESDIPMNWIMCFRQLRHKAPSANRVTFLNAFLKQRA
jgi:hypothetical protein